MIDDEARSSSRSGEREGLAPLIVYVHYTDFCVICKAFSQELFAGIKGSYLGTSSVVLYSLCCNLPTGNKKSIFNVFESEATQSSLMKSMTSGLAHLLRQGVWPRKRNTMESAIDTFRLVVFTEI